MEERGISVYEILMTLDLPLSESSLKITTEQFRALLRVLDLPFTLLEKHTIFRAFDPNRTGFIELNTLLHLLERREDVLKNDEAKRKRDDLPKRKEDGTKRRDKSGRKEEEGGLGERGKRVLLEKLAIGLFRKDLGLGGAFEEFDLDGDGIITGNEFIYGLNQIGLGLSIFEIREIMKVVDLDKDGTIARSEFETVLGETFKQMNIQPEEGLQLNLMEKIRKLVNEKGSDLEKSLEEEDKEGGGRVDMEGLRRGLVSFGLTHVKKYQVNMLIKIYRRREGEQKKQGRQRSVVMSASTETVDYKDFTKIIMVRI